jgi:hypothetical protein
VYPFSDEAREVGSLDPDAALAETHRRQSASVDPVPHGLRVELEESATSATVRAHLDLSTTAEGV